MQKTPQPAHGGKRSGAGRPRQEPTERMTVPLGLADMVRTIIDARKLNVLIQFPKPSSGRKLPLYGSHVKAGFPSPADDYVEDAISIDEDMVKHREATFLVRAAGDSMIGAHIQDGTKLVVDRSLEPRNGDIVVAVIDGDLTVKTLEKKRGRIRLLPENSAYQPIEIKEGQELVIWGVVVGHYYKIRRR